MITTCWLIFIVNKWTDTILFMWCINKWEWTICYHKKNKVMSVFHVFVYYWWRISSLHCQSSMRIHLAIPLWIHSYFDYVMTKLMINDRTDAWKTDVNLINIHCTPGRDQTDTQCPKQAIPSHSHQFNSYSARILLFLYSSLSCCFQ